MKAMNTLTSREKKSFSAAIKGDALQGLIRAAVPSAADAARLTGTLISAVASNQKLQECNPASVVAAALRGEGMKLVYNQDYYLVPYGDKCQYILGYKGLLHLLIATGEVADTNCFPVLEGEYKGRNKKTKRPEFDFSVYETADDEAGHEVLGYYFYVELRNGYTASEYMRVSDIILHAQRYSQSFDVETFRKLQRGEYDPKEAEKIRAKSPWYGNFELMACKTVIRKLLNSGFVPLANSAELRRAIDEDGETGEGEILSADILGGMNGDYVVVESTGEVIDTPQDAPEQPESDSEPQMKNDTAELEKPQRAAKRGRKPQEVKPVPVEADDAIESFFGDAE